MSEVVARVRRWLWAPLLAISLALVAGGLATGGFETVLGWFNQLCASCIGLSGH